MNVKINQASEAACLEFDSITCITRVLFSIRLFSHSNHTSLIECKPNSLALDAIPGGPNYHDSLACAFLLCIVYV